jgi:hypothetical protein
MNVVASDQYIAIVLPGRMFRAEYARRGLHPKNLSRSLEDAGTLTSVLVPWNTCGAFMAQTLGVATFTYAPFAFFNLLNPLVALIYGFTGFTIRPGGPVRADCPVFDRWLATPAVVKICHGVTEPRRYARRLSLSRLRAPVRDRPADLWEQSSAHSMHDVIETDARSAAATRRR